MKVKKRSAFAVLHGKNANVVPSRKNEVKIATAVNSIQKKKKQPSIKPSLVNPRSVTKVKESLSFTKLEKSPSTRKTRQTASCPDVRQKAPKPVPGSAALRKSPRKATTIVPTEEMHQEPVSLITLKSTEFISKTTLLPNLDDNEAKDKEVKNNGLNGLLNSKAEADKCFEWLIHPVKTNKFFSELWEMKPLLVKRHSAAYYKGIFTCLDFDTILREKPLYFTKNIDITTYIDGKRETHNPKGRAYPRLVWDYYSNGCSIRLLNPQTFSKPMWKLNSLLQEYFGSCVGANVYLTPPGTQGFAPHYDDIEAFVLQLEGKKRWKLYNPRDEMESLPRFSSGNFTDADVGEPILNIELEPGDLLYFPRGTIHQATTSDVHSLHITVSTYQRNTWGDFLEKLVPRALEMAIEENVELREGLPCNYLEYVGVAHSDRSEPRRTEFFDRLGQMMSKVLERAVVDACADQMGKQYIHDCLPPLLNKAEKSRSIHGTKECWKNGPTSSLCSLDAEATIRLVRANILRLVTEGEDVLVYHSVDNSREYHGEEPQCFEISCDYAPAVEMLVHAYPDYVAVKELPLDDVQDRVIVANVLYERGIVLTKQCSTTDEKTNVLMSGDKA